LIVPAAIGAMNELVMPCELREIVTAPLTVLAAIGAVPETDEMPGAGYAALIYAAIWVAVILTEVPL
jgi:hypothetical protein